MNLQDIIAATLPLSDTLRDLNSSSPYVGAARQALSAARDNLKWELEAAAEEKKAAGSAPAAPVQE